MPDPVGTPVMAAVLAVATLADLHRREVPCWLTFGSISVGVLIAASNGAHTLAMSLLGLTVGGLIMLPFVVIDAFGAADALLLAAVGAWQGPLFVVWTAWWTSLAGAVLAIVAWRRGRPTFPYVPAIAIGAALGIISGCPCHQHFLG